MTELLSLLLLIIYQNCTFAYHIHLLLTKNQVLKLLKSKLQKFMPVLRKPGSHKSAAFRQTSERNVLNNPYLKFVIPALHHTPSPNMPTMNLLQFEITLLTYLTMAMVIQYVNIYKANFYVMDYYLVMIISLILLRRVYWLLLKQTLASEVMYSMIYWSKVAGKALLLLSYFLLITLSIYSTIQTSALEDVLFLCYPVILYLLTFGFTLNPYSHSVLFKLVPHQSYNMQDLVSNNTSLFHQAVTLQTNLSTRLKKTETNGLHNGKAGKGNTANGHISNGGIMEILENPQSYGKEACTMSPDTVRYEAQCLRTDFYLRIKQILFNSLISAYYVGFIPLKFTQNGWLYYDVWWSMQHIFFVWINTFMLLITFLVPHHYINGLHKCAIHLGGWKKYTGQRDTTPHIWSPLTTWPRDALVRHNKGLFRAIENQNTATPGDVHHSRFYYIFNSPLRLLNWLTIIQLASVIGQFYVLLWSRLWYQCLSVVLMSPISYYLLFRILRGRWAVEATLKEHQTINTGPAG